MVMRCKGQRNDGLLDLRRLDCLGAALRDACLTYNSNTALIETDRVRDNTRLTYPQLRAEAEMVAARLQAAGFSPGDRCAIVMSNQSKWVIAGLGALWAGAVLVPLDYKLTAAEQLALLAHAKPKALITEYPLWRSLAQAGRTPFQGLVITVSEAPAMADLAGAGRWEDKVATDFRYVERGRRDTACIVYSSGTGGTPKGCMLTHDSYLTQAQA
ncbi:MAG: long-chain fatty acid--CoA ligase, partial [Proteobacteria bacterium]|nr:long-chain fatty acid--CoA ligase [Pseudomonadota bacterium]